MSRHLILASFVVIGSVLRIFAAAPVVVVPDEATAVEKFAASELAGELGKCLGETPEIVREGAYHQAPCLYVGATKAAREARADGTGCRPYRTDEIFLKSVQNGVVLDGDPIRAPIYAVDLYLEKYCGVRWWTSGDAAQNASHHEARHSSTPARQICRGGVKEWPQTSVST